MAHNIYGILRQLTDSLEKFSITEKIQTLLNGMNIINGITGKKLKTY
jgi:hypothetical protein